MKARRRQEVYICLFLFDNIVLTIVDTVLSMENKHIYTSGHRFLFGSAASAARAGSLEIAEWIAGQLAG